MKQLSKAKKDEIRRLAALGLAKTEIARRVQCHVQTVDRVLSPDAREYHRIRSQNRNEQTKNQRAAQNKRQRERTSHESTVYLLHSADHGLYKIGVTGNLTYRMRQMHCPDLGLLKSFPGVPALEQFLHDKLETRWESGEWYRFNSAEQAVQLVTSLVEEYNDDA